MAGKKRGVLTLFRVQCADGVEKVQVVGSWDGWEEKFDMTREEAGEGWWSGHVFVPLGKILFKFVCDGNWICGKGYDIEDDGFGGGNNWMEVCEALEEEKKAQVPQNTPHLETCVKVEMVMENGNQNREGNHPPHVNGDHEEKPSEQPEMKNEENMPAPVAEVQPLELEHTSAKDTNDKDEKCTIC